MRTRWEEMPSIVKLALTALVVYALATIVFIVLSFFGDGEEVGTRLTP